MIFPQHIQLALCLGRAVLTLPMPGCSPSGDFLPWCPLTPLLLHLFAPSDTAASKSKASPKTELRGQSQDTSGRGWATSSACMQFWKSTSSSVPLKIRPHLLCLLYLKKEKTYRSALPREASRARSKAYRNQWRDTHRHLWVAWSKQQPCRQAAKRITCQEQRRDTHADAFWLSGFMRRWEGTCGVKSFIP